MKDRIVNLVVNEPVVIAGAVEAVVLLLIGFGLDLTGDQVALIMTAVTAILALVARALVTPVAQVALTNKDAEALRNAGF